MGDMAVQFTDVMRDWIDRKYPGSLMPFQFFDGLEDAFNGFGVRYGDSLSLIFINSSNIADWQWTVNVYSGLRLDAPDPVDCLMWTNKKNRANMFGRYHVATHRENGTSAVIFDNSLPGQLFQSGLQDRQLANYMQGLVQATIEWAAADAQESEVLGGRPLPQDESGLMILFHTGDPG